MTLMELSGERLKTGRLLEERREQRKAQVKEDGGQKMLARRRRVDTIYSELLEVRRVGWHLLRYCNTVSHLKHRKLYFK